MYEDNARWEIRRLRLMSSREKPKGRRKAETGDNRHFWLFVGAMIALATILVIDIVVTYWCPWCDTHLAQCR
jgi:hypothetical protein